MEAMVGLGVDRAGRLRGRRGRLAVMAQGYK